MYVPETRSTEEAGLPFESHWDIMEAYSDWPYYNEFSPDYFIE